MHTAQTARETLELLWGNHLLLCERVDLGAMPPNVLETYVEQNSPVRPFRIASWLARYGYFISAWTLWECYSRSLCQNLPNKEERARKESIVDWVGRSLSANSRSFADQFWFADAYCIRNLIAHSGGRVEGTRAEKLFERSRKAFANIDKWPDGYLVLEHEHVAELQIKIEDFILETE